MDKILWPLLLISFPVLAVNENAWHPDSNIPNIHLTELYTYFGLPRDTVDGREIEILVNHGYAIGYSEAHKGPLYAVYRYGNLQNSAEDLDERSFERPPKFQIDLRTEARVCQDDYTGSGFDRGHMAPNYGLRTQYGHLAQMETFFMSNILPQHGNLNRHTWVDAEKKIANEYAQDDMGTNKTSDDIKDLWVVSGPVYGGEQETLGDTGIAIPTGFYKIIVRKKTFFDNSVQAIGLFYPHIEPYTDVAPQLKTIDWIEEKTGLDFHPNMTDNREDKLEETLRDMGWEKVE